MIVDYLDSHRGRFGVEPISAVLAEVGIQIAPSTYYARTRCPVTAAELAEAYLVNALVDLHQANWGVYGARKLWHAARRAGHDVGRDQGTRLIKDRRDHRHGPRAAPHRDHAARHDRPAAS